MPRTSLLLALAGSTSIAAARPDVAAAQDLFPVHRVDHLYINLKTGERVMTPYDDRAGPGVWNNDDSAVCGNFFYGIDRPTRATTDPRPRFGGSINSVGDVRIAFQHSDSQRIDGLGIGTASVGVKSTNTTAHECAGLDVILFFYQSDNANGAAPDTQAEHVRTFTIRDIPAEEGTGNGWQFTFDLSSSGIDFRLGGPDLDGDQRPDFGWGMSFVQGQSLTDGINSAKGIIGPWLVAPAGFVNELGVASTSTATNVPNRLHWYSAVTFDSSGQPQDRSHQSFIGSYDFGTPSSTNPFASPYLILRGVLCTPPADFNGDGFLDFTDFDDFVVAFEVGDPSADFNQDHFLDFTDFDDFVAAFEASC